MKRLVSALLVLILALTLAPGVRAAAVVPSNQKFLLDGKAAAVTAYNIDGYNYVMLRGLAALLNGTEKQFSVTWDEAALTVRLETGKAYEADPAAANGPAVLTDSRGRVTNAVKSGQALVIDGETVSGISAYNIGGNNYFKLADLKPWLGYGLDYAAAARAVSITTAQADPGALTLTAAGDYAAVLSILDQARKSNIPKGGGASIAVEEEAAVADAAAPAPNAAPAPEAAAEGDYSGTNVQVAGIDEGDVVKTDGTYLYILRGDRLILARADGKDTRVLSSTPVGSDTGDGKDGWKSKHPRELYIAGDRVAVLSSCDENVRGAKGLWQYRSYTAVDLYDVSDPARPQAAASLGQDGWTMGSRLKDGVLYLVTNYGVSTFDKKDPGTFVPCLYAEGKAEALPAGDVWLCPHPDATRYVVVTAYDLAAGTATDSKSVLGGGDILYMSHNSIYVADSHYRETAGTPRTERVYTVTDYRSEMVTDIVRFDLAGGLTVAADGTVPGGLDDQFSMDEYGGHLRLVTTASGNAYTVYADKEMGFVNYRWHEDGKQTNGLYILDNSLAVVGKVEDLAPGERIYSARFDGDIAYFCTFRNMDPLFAVDVSVPSAPVVLSALKISGFSDYLHPWAEGLLFGAGYEADPANGRTEGIKLVMFDTSDKADVTAKAVRVTDLSFSEALDDHHAFLISREKNLIAFPADEQYVIFGYDPDRGFYEQATVDLGDWSWNSRGLYVGDALYVAGFDTLYVISLDGFGLVKTVDLPVE